MASDAYTYIVRLAPTALTAAKSLIQIKAGNAGLEVLACCVFQTTKTSSELWNLSVLRKTAAATVTAFTPLKLAPNDPASLAVGGTAATGVNATAEGTDSDILHDDGWNVLNASWLWMPVPEDRPWVSNTGMLALKLQTTPAASTTVGAWIKYREYL
jgi:hypothetical protein